MTRIAVPRQLLKHELQAKRKGFRLVLGIDEAGRGPLAGPVVASAVALCNYHFESTIRDSKKLSARQREKAFLEIWEKAYVGVGVANESVIDEHNILNATFLAMTNAVRHLLANLPQEQRLGSKPKAKVCLLVDGNRFNSDLPYPYVTIVDGESASLSVACASIVAKVIRDRILMVYDKIFPQYGFQHHKGYGTRQHRQAIKRYGLSPIHRKSFHFHT
jgi:ribonuclease HII